MEIQGFKSFPDRTRLTFEKNITEVVGPNGSGKSNIADAVLWVMGEQRVKTLRGARMEDVIFGGTALRNPMGYAEVSLVIDNSAHIFDSDTPEVELTRRYYRSGDSEYYINREQVRLKDINSLLMDTGLGRDGYSIIGQGKIADIVSTKSTDRREIFDEAAGISRYRYRKEEAEHRLEKTDENLVRINDKIEELELQVGPLKEQAETARKYLIFRDDLRIKEVSLWMESLDRLHEKAEAVNTEYAEASSALETAQRELEALYASSEGITDRMHRKDEESEKAREALEKIQAEAAECEASAAVLKTRLTSARESAERLTKDISEQETRAQEIREKISENTQRISELDKQLLSTREKLAENTNIIAGCRMKLASRETALAEVSDRANRITVERRSLEGRINMLSEMERDYEGYSKAVKAVMRASAGGALRGIHGPVSTLIKTENDYALAIETALGAAGQNIVTDTKETGRSAIEMLKRNDSGRATFLPLDTIRGSAMRDAPSDEEGYVGIASDLTYSDRPYRRIVEYLLGKTVIVETLQDAIRISRKYSDRFRIVTLDGQMMNIGGSMSGGSVAKGTGILSRANELAALKEKHIKLKDDEDNCTAELEKSKASLAAVRYQLEMTLEDRNALSSEESSLSTESGTIKNTVRQFEVLLEAVAGGRDSREKASEETQRQINSIIEEIKAKQEELRHINTAADEAKRKIDAISQDKLSLEARRVKTEKETQEHNARLLELERRVSRAEQKKSASDMEEKQILDKLWDNYELSHSAAQMLRLPVESVPKATKEIGDLRRQISALGTPNLGAIEEYERVNTRYEFLTGQRDDVEKARKELLGIISEVTTEMTSVFKEQFAKIDEAFRQTFHELFGGGKAALKLEDENNILECGIDIVCQPPGKALSSLTLLSGGEMAFVAIALYFAILKVRPTPFCVMDEIDAALDEANVTRFAEYMRKMSAKTQFLVITHRRGTMDEADMLYGVTMQEKGVSMVLRLDLEQARQSIEG